MNLKTLSDDALEKTVNTILKNKFSISKHRTFRNYPSSGKMQPRLSLRRPTIEKFSAYRRNTAFSQLHNHSSMTQRLRSRRNTPHPQLLALEFLNSQSAPSSQSKNKKEKKTQSTESVNKGKTAVANEKVQNLSANPKTEKKSANKSNSDLDAKQKTEKKICTFKSKSPKSSPLTSNIDQRSTPHSLGFGKSGNEAMMRRRDTPHYLALGNLFSSLTQKPQKDTSSSEENKARTLKIETARMRRRDTPHFLAIPTKK